MTDRPGSVVVRRRDEPSAPPRGSVTLRVEVVGVCGSDVHIFGVADGELSFPLVQGHEISAVVCAVGPGCPDAPPVGARVAVWPLFACGACRACRCGRDNACVDIQLLGVHLDGGFQELLTVPADHVFDVGTLPAEVTAMVEPVSVAVHAVRRGQVVAGDAVVVFGGGAIGQAAAFVALAAGARVHVVELLEQRRAVAASLGAATSDGRGTEAREWCGADGADVVIDTSAAGVVLDLAVALAGSAARIVLVGLASAPVQFTPGPVTLKELDVLGSSASDAGDFREAVALVAANPDAIARLVTHRVGLHELPRALELVADRDPSVVKVVVDIRQASA